MPQNDQAETNFTPDTEASPEGPTDPDLVALWSRLRDEMPASIRVRWLEGLATMLLAEVEYLRVEASIASVQRITTAVGQTQPAEAGPSDEKSSSGEEAEDRGLYVSTSADELKKKLDEVRREGERVASKDRQAEYEKLVAEGRPEAEARVLAAVLRAWPLEIPCAFCQERFAPEVFYDHAVSVHADRLGEIEKALPPKELWPSGSVGLRAFTPEEAEDGRRGQPVPYPVAPENLAQKRVRLRGFASLGVDDPELRVSAETAAKKLGWYDLEWAERSGMMVLLGRDPKALPSVDQTYVHHENGGSFTYGPLV